MAPQSLSGIEARGWEPLPHTSQPLAVGLEGCHSQARGEVALAVQSVKCQQPHSS